MIKYDNVVMNNEQALMQHHGNVMMKDIILGCTDESLSSYEDSSWQCHDEISNAVMNHDQAMMTHRGDVMMKQVTLR